MFTKDKAFCKALWENYDVHMEWAERLSRAYPERIGGKKNFTDKKVMKDFRTDIKNQWTFPLFFGAQLKSASGYLSIPEDVLGPEYEKFWQQFEGVKRWQEKQLEFYRAHGYVECLTKRRRHGPLNENKIYNSPVQGTAAEIVMDGMCRLSELGDWDLQPEINIHDDLTFCRVPVKKVDEIAERVINEMLDVPYDFVNVPITVEASVGSDWLKMDEFGTFSSHTWFKK
jgi:DNA polymerase I-like protein with 3'-5' exonuclease and polymerase domains